MSFLILPITVALLIFIVRLWPVLAQVSVCHRTSCPTSRFKRTRQAGDSIRVGYLFEVSFLTQSYPRAA
jgi:hypothetical protein